MAYDPSVYEARRRGIFGQYDAQSAANEYARFLSQQRGSRQLGAFQRGVTEQIPTFGRTYGRRGLYGQGVKSGVFNKALSRFGEESARQLGYLQGDIAAQQREFDLRGAEYLAQRERDLADLEAQKLRTDIGQTAAGLLGLS